MFCINSLGPVWTWAEILIFFSGRVGLGPNFNLFLSGRNNNFLYGAGRLLNFCIGPVQTEFLTSKNSAFLKYNVIATDENTFIQVASKILRQTFKEVKYMMRIENCITRDRK